MEPLEEGSKVRKRDNSESGDFVIVKQSNNSTPGAQDSDTSFEDLQENIEVKKAREDMDTDGNDPVELESMVIVNDINDEEKSVKIKDTADTTVDDNVKVEEEKEEKTNNITCQDNVRQVLYDIEAQIEKLRDAVTKLSGDQSSLVEVLDSVHQGLPGTDLSEIEREEIGLELTRLRSRAEDVKCELVTRRTEQQLEARKVMEGEMVKLIRTVEEDPEADSSERLCRSYLAACSGGAVTGSAVNTKFERIVLDCNVEDQKAVRQRLNELLQNILVLKQGT